MDFCDHSMFTMVQGVLVDMDSPCMGDRSLDGCVLRMGVEDENGNTVNFVVTPATFVVDWETLAIGKKCMFWYRTDAPMPLIYPPQYNAVAAALERNDRMIDVSYYDESLTNAEQTLQLHIDGSVKLRTVNNQVFSGNPGEKNLVVIYETSTRSIPAQTTPKEVVVLCECGMGAD